MGNTILSLMSSGLSTTMSASEWVTSADCFFSAASLTSWAHSRTISPSGLQLVKTPSYVL